MKKKILALIMAFTLVASLAACGGTTDNANSKDSNSNTTSTVEKEKDTTDKKDTDSSKTDEKKDNQSSASDKSNKETSSSKNDNKTSSSTSSSKTSSSGSSSSSKPSSGSGNSGNSSSTNKPHQHNYNTVVSSTDGDCSHKGKVTKKCSCGATITVDGNYGSHNWKNNFKEIHHEAVTKPVYAYCYVCNKCGAQFNDEQTCGEHCIFDCGGTYSYKEWIDHYETVTPAWTEKVPNGKECTICGKHSN